MKPSGAIPADFAAIDGRLRAGGVDALDLAAEAGTPLFVYDFGIVRARIIALRAALPPAISIHYAMKANPLAALVRAIAPLVDGIDIASGGEQAIAVGAGVRPDIISFAGPGKRDAELEGAIAAGVTINLESAGEGARALAIAGRLGVTPRLAVRVNPDFALKGSGMRMGGGPAPFGVDAEHVPALVRHLIAEGAEWRGLHIFAGSQSLDSTAIAETQAATVRLAGDLAEAIGTAPPLCNLGGGFGIPYFANEQPIDIASIGSKLGQIIDDQRNRLRLTRFAVELGRWLVGEAGVYLTRVIDRKESRGETFLVTDGGLHHQLAATGNFGTVVRRNYPIAVAGRFGASPEEIVSVVGCLCTPLDRLGDKVALPHAQIGDTIAIFMAGAYGASASPAHFLAHGPAAERLVGV